MPNTTDDYSTGYFMPIKYFAPINDILTATLSILGNIILINLVIFRSTKELRVYSRLLILNSVVDLFYTTSVLVTQAAIDFDKGVILMMMGGPFRHAPHPITWHLITWYVTSLFSCVMFLPIPFIFRYFTVCRQKILNFWEFSTLVFIFLFIALAYGCLHGYAFYPFDPELNNSEYKYIIDHEFWKDSEERLPVYVVADLNKSKKILVLVSCCCFLSSFSYSLVILCNFLIYRQLKTLKTSMSKKARDVQKALTKVLEYQAVVPFLICVLPLGLVLILCAIRIRTAGKGLLLTIMVAWIPVLNPFAAIFLVKEYRTFFTKSMLFLRIKAFILRKDIEDILAMTSFTQISTTRQNFKTRTGSILPTVLPLEVNNQDIKF